MGRDKQDIDNFGSINNFDNNNNVLERKRK